MSLRRICFCLIFFCYSIISSGQSDTLFANHEGRIAIVFSPSAMLNATIPAVQGGLRLKVYKDFHFQSEAGWMIDNEPYLWRRGYRTLNEIRYYLEPENRLYLGAQFRYWKQRAIDEGVFCRNDCLFTQTIQYQIDQQGIGYAVTMGITSEITKKLYFEFGTSIGALNRKNRTNLPQDVDLAGFRDVFFSFFGRNDRWRDYDRRIRNVRFNLRLGYWL